MNAGAIHMKTGENMHETWTLQSTDFPRTKEYSPKAQNHKTGPQHQTKQVDWASTQPEEGTREEPSPGEPRPVRPNRPTGSAELTGGPPWPIFLWRFVTDVWRSVPPAINATDVWNRLQVADLPRL